MIVVTVELRSAISHTRNKVLGVLTIANDGTGNDTTGNYRARLTGVRGRSIDTCMIKGFPRKRLLGWDLVYRVLRATRGDRNGDDVTGNQRRVLDVARVVTEMRAAGHRGSGDPTSRQIDAWATALERAIAPGCDVNAPANGPTSSE